MYTLKYILEESLILLKKNITMSISSMLIIITSLCLLGFFIITQQFLNVILKNIEENLQIVVFLESGINESIILKKIIPEIKSYPQVLNVEYISKEKASEEFKKNIPELKDIFSIIEENPLPASLKIKVKDINDIKIVAEKIKNENSILIDEINYGGENFYNFLKISYFFKKISVTYLLIFVFASIIVISSAIKLDVYSQKIDIEIMKLVGATNFYIKMPYIIKGSLIGLISSIISIIFVYFVQQSVILEIFKIFKFISYTKFDLLSTFDISLKLLIVGVLQGIIGAIWAVSKVLAEKE